MMTGPRFITVRRLRIFPLPARVCFEAYTFRMSDQAPILRKTATASLVFFTSCSLSDKTKGISGTVSMLWPEQRSEDQYESSSDWTNLSLRRVMEHPKQQWHWQARNVVVSDWFFGATFARLSMVRTFDHHDTCCRKHLDRSDAYHHHGHEEYGPQHDQYPTIQRRFVHLYESNKYDGLATREVVSLTSFGTDSMRLSFVTSHLIVNEIHNVGTDRSSKNSRQDNWFSCCLTFLIVNGNKRSRGGLKTSNLRYRSRTCQNRTNHFSWVFLILTWIQKQMDHGRYSRPPQKKMDRQR